MIDTIVSAEDETQRKLHQIEESSDQSCILQEQEELSCQHLIGEDKIQDTESSGSSSSSRTTIGESS
jgi:hypothetical protein